MRSERRGTPVSSPSSTSASRSPCSTPSGAASSAARCWLTVAWAAILTAGAMAFRRQDTPVVQLALTIASLTYGGLLGTYLLGGLWPRARERDVILAVVISVAVMAPIVLGAVIPRFP